MLDKKMRMRQIRELYYLLESDVPIKLTDLSDILKLQITNKTLYNDFNIIQSFSHDNGVTINKVNDLININSSNESKENLKNIIIDLLNNHLIIYDERKIFIIFDILFKDRIPTLDEFSEKFNISRPRIQNDMKEVKEWLHKKNINLLVKHNHGYIKIFEEYDLRIAMICCLSEIYGDNLQCLVNGIRVKGYIYTEWDNVFKTINFPDIHSFIKNLDSLMEDRDTNKNYPNIIIYIALMILRCGNGCYVKESIENIRIFSNKIKIPSIEDDETNNFMNFSNVYIPIEEYSVLINKYFLNKSNITNNSLDLYNLDQLANELARNITVNAEKILRIPFTQQYNFINMLSTHISNTIKKYKLGIKIETMDLDNIKQQYPLEYSIGTQFCEIVKHKLNIILPDFEGIFVAMYIAAEMEKMNNEINKKKNTILISPNNLSAATLLYWQLSNNFSSQINITKIFSYYEFVNRDVQDSNTDLIISTIPINNQSCTNIVISPFLTPTDIKNINKILETENNNFGHNCVKDMIKESVIIFNESSTDTKALITKIGNNLVNNNYAKKGYVDELLQHENIFGCGLNMKIPIAIPHAPPNFTVKTNLTIVITNKKMKFKEIGSNKNIETNLIIFPLLVPDNSEGLYFYSFLSTLKNNKFTKKFLNCKTKDEIIKLFES